MRPSSSIFRALTWRRRTPTATAERTMSAVGVKTASERLRQRSASSPASSRASGGARVRARVEEEIMTVVRCVFIGIGAALHYYTGAPGDSHLRNTWPSCSISEVVPHPTHAWIGRSHFSGFQVKELALKTDLIFVSVSSADKGAKKIFDSFNRMHMIWRDRV